MGKVEKVLVVAYYFPPKGLSGVFRIAKFVKYLPQFGWDVSVLTDGKHSNTFAYDYSLLEELQHPMIHISATDVEIPHVQEGENNHRGQLYYPSRFLQKTYHVITSFYAIPDTKYGWRKKALKLAEKILQEKTIDVVLATAPPYTDFLVGYDIAKQFNLPLVLDYRDPWTDNAFRFYPTPYHKIRNEILEEKVLRAAAAVIVLDREMKEKLLQRYRFLNYQDVHIIPHGYDPEDYVRSSESTQKDEKLILTHVGLFQDNRTPKYFLQAVRTLLDEHPLLQPRLELRFVGLLRKRDLQLIKHYGLEANAIITGYVSHLQALEQMMESHVLWLTLQDEVRTPSKLYEYFGARRPVLAMVRKRSLQEQVRQYGAGWVVPPDDVPAIVSALRQIVALWERREFPKPNEEFVSQFDRRVQTEQLSTILRKVIPIEKSTG